MNRMHSLLSLALASVALTSVACTASEQLDEENAGTTAQATTREGAALDDLTAAPRHTGGDVTCKTITGSHIVTKAQCEKLLNAQGCKPGAVVGGEQTCSTAGDQADPSSGPTDLTAVPRHTGGDVTCKTITGSHVVTQAQCEKLLNAQGCKPGAVVGGEQTCTTVP